MCTVFQSSELTVVFVPLCRLQKCLEHLYSPSINSISIKPTAFSTSPNRRQSATSCALATINRQTFYFCSIINLSDDKDNRGFFFQSPIPIVAGSTGSINSSRIHTLHFTCFVHILVTIYPTDAIFAATLGITSFRLILFLRHVLPESSV